jgi:hypothetical protein
MSRTAHPFARPLSILLASTAMMMGYSQMTATAAEPTAAAKPAAPAPAPAGENPMLAPWTGPFEGVPPWDKMDPELFPDAFAKAMDPDSVVREGEYATVQKYAQSWAESFGFNAARIFSNTTFLTPQARANMKATIRQRYQAGLGQYNNVRKSFGDRINKITRKGDGLERLTDYAAGFPTGTAAPAAPASGGGIPSYQDYLARQGKK